MTSMANFHKDDQAVYNQSPQALPRSDQRYGTDIAFLALFEAPREYKSPREAPPTRMKRGRSQLKLYALATLPCTDTGTPVSTCNCYSDVSDSTDGRDAGVKVELPPVRNNVGAKRHGIIDRGGCGL